MQISPRLAMLSLKIATGSVTKLSPAPPRRPNSGPRMSLESELGPRMCVSACSPNFGTRHAQNCVVRLLLPRRRLRRARLDQGHCDTVTLCRRDELFGRSAHAARTE